MFGFKSYCGCGASTGQTFAQAPQSMQASLTTEIVSPAEIAFTGHSGSQAPQEIQESLITYISIPPYKISGAITLGFDLLYYEFMYTDNKPFIKISKIKVFTMIIIINFDRVK